MTTIVSTEKQLGEAVKRGDEYIEIVGPLSKKVSRIKSIGKYAWYAAIGGIAAAVYTYLTAAEVAILATSTAPITAPAIAGTAGAISFTGHGLMVGTTVSVIGSTITVSVLGASATISAFLIAVAGGGIESLSRLRSYKIKGKTNDKIILKK